MVARARGRRYFHVTLVLVLVAAACGDSLESKLDDAAAGDASAPRDDSAAADGSSSEAATSHDGAAKDANVPEGSADGALPDAAAEASTDAGVDAPLDGPVDAGPPTETVAWTIDVKMTSHPVGDATGISAALRTSVDDIIIVGTGAHQVGGNPVVIDLGGGPKTGRSFIGAFDANGVYKWDHFYDGTPAGHILALDTADNLYVAMRFTGTFDFGGGPRTAAANGSVAIVSYDAAGAYRWDVALTPTSGTGYVDTLTIGAYGADRIVLGGYFRGQVDFAGQSRTATAPAGYDEGYVLVLGASGAYEWDRSFGGSSRTYAAAIDPNGQVSIGGQAGGTIDLGGGPHAFGTGFIATYTPVGALVSDLTFGKNVPVTKPYPSGDLFAGHVTPNGAVRLNAAGATVWSRTAPTMDPAVGRNGSGIAIGIADELWTGLPLATSSTGRQIIRYPDDGSPVERYYLPWRQPWGSQIGTGFYTMGVAVLSGGDIISAGRWTAAGGLGSIASFSRVTRPPIP